MMVLLPFLRLKHELLVFAGEECGNVSIKQNNGTYYLYCNRHRECRGSVDGVAFSARAKINNAGDLEVCKKGIHGRKEFSEVREVEADKRSFAHECTREGKSHAEAEDQWEKDKKVA